MNGLISVCTMLNLLSPLLKSGNRGIKASRNAEFSQLSLDKSCKMLERFQYKSWSLFLNQLIGMVISEEVLLCFLFSLSTSSFISSLSVIRIIIRSLMVFRSTGGSLKKFFHAVLILRLLLSGSLSQHLTSILFLNTSRHHRENTMEESFCEFF